MTSPEAVAPDELAREAATWFARMRGPNEAAHRPAFEAWLARDPSHRAAYNRAGEIFAMGKLLADDRRTVETRSRRWQPMAAAMAACLIAAVFWVSMRGPAPVSTPIAASPLITAKTLATEAGERRFAKLEDGSTAQLASDSRLKVSFGTTQRILTLEKGSARFDVHHETRPFIVMAGGGSVTARGTMFDVTLTRPGQVEVRLLRGVIDVRLPRWHPDQAATVRRLVAGETIAFVAPVASPAPMPHVDASGSETASVTTDAGARDFVSMPVATLIATANRSSSRPIRLADGALGDERVSGRLRVDDTNHLARRLSDLFGWSVDMRDPKEIVLRP